MRNLRLLATVLFVAVLLVGVVLLLRPTNVQNDTSVTSTSQVTSQQLAVNTTADTDPPLKVKKAKGAVISNGVQPIRTKLEKSKGSSARTTATQSELTPIGGLSITPGNLPAVTRTQRSAPAVTKTTSWNPKASKAEQVRALQQMLREESNPQAKTKIQHKLNTLK